MTNTDILLPTITAEEIAVAFVNGEYSRLAVDLELHPSVDPFGEVEVFATRYVAVLDAEFHDASTLARPVVLLHTDAGDYVFDGAEEIEVVFDFPFC